MTSTVEVKRSYRDCKPISSDRVSIYGSRHRNNQNGEPELLERNGRYKCIIVDGTLPQVKALVGATGPDGTELGIDIACRLDEQTEIKRGLSIIKEMPSAEQATEILIVFGTNVGAQLLATWLYDKISKRKGGRLEIEGLTIELDKGKIERILIDKLKSE